MSNIQLISSLFVLLLLSNATFAGINGGQQQHQQAGTIENQEDDDQQRIGQMNPAHIGGMRLPDNLLVPAQMRYIPVQNRLAVRQTVEPTIGQMSGAASGTASMNTPVLVGMAPPLIMSPTSTQPRAGPSRFAPLTMNPRPMMNQRTANMFAQPSQNLREPVMILGMGSYGVRANTINPHNDIIPQLIPTGLIGRPARPISDSLNLISRSNSHGPVINAESNRIPLHHGELVNKFNRLQQQLQQYGVANNEKRRLNEPVRGQQEPLKIGVESKHGAREGEASASHNHTIQLVQSKRARLTPMPQHSAPVPIAAGASTSQLLEARLPSSSTEPIPNPPQPQDEQTDVKDKAENSLIYIHSDGEKQNDKDKGKKRKCLYPYPCPGGPFCAMNH